MRKTITLLLCSFFTSLSLIAQWSELGGPQGFSAGQAFWVSMDFDGTIPYVTYRDCANGCSPTVMKFNGTVWQNVGSAGITGAGCDYTSIAVNQSIPYIAFADGANGNKLSVMKYSAGNWSYVGAAGSTSIAITGVSIAFDNANNLYVAYLASGSGSVKLMKWNGTSWINISMSGFPTNGTTYAGISFNNLTPYISFSDFNSGNIYVEKFNSATNVWNAVGAPIAGAAPSKICFDMSGNPHMAYSDPALKVMVVKYNGTAWSSVGTPLSISTASVGTPSNGMALALDGNTPYVAYSDIANNGKLSTSSFNGSSWSLVGSPLFAQGINTFDYSNIKVVSGTPYVAYSARSAAISNLRAFAMKYDISTSVNSLTNEVTAAVYPNPTNGIVFIESPSLSNTASCQLTDVTGRIIFNHALTSTKEQLDISQLNNGIYF